MDYCQGAKSFIHLDGCYVFSLPAWIIHKLAALWNGYGEDLKGSILCRLDVYATLEASHGA